MRQMFKLLSAQLVVSLERTCAPFQSTKPRITNFIVSLASFHNSCSFSGCHWGSRYSIYRGHEPSRLSASVSIALLGTERTSDQLESRRWPQMSQIGHQNLDVRDQPHRRNPVGVVDIDYLHLHVRAAVHAEMQRFSRYYVGLSHRVDRDQA